jgi:Protein of unknown function (DUF4058)
MPSPFPGMNPYLEREAAWHDFHERFIPAAAEEIGRQVRPAYIVRIDENVYVHELPEGDRRLLGRPDMYVVEGTRQQSSGSIGFDGGASAADSRTARAPNDYRARWVY